MKSRDEVKKLLIERASAEGLSGTAVDFMASLAATAYYEALLNNINLNNEANAETAVSTNSLINSSAERMYSVFRGKNPTVKIKGRSSEYIELKRGDLIYEGEDFKLFVKNNTLLLPNPDRDIEIELIVSNKYYHIEKDSIDVSYVEFLLNDLSNDTLLLRDGIIVDTTKIFIEHIRNGTPFDLTISGFGVRYYFPDKLSAILTLSGFQYIQDIDLTELTTDSINITNFLVTGSVVVNYGNTRESNESIKMNHRLQVDSMYLFRSNSDLEDTFRLKFSDKCIDVKYEFKDIGGLPKIVFYYIPKDEYNKVSVSEFEEYEADTKNYFLMDEFHLTEATPVTYKLSGIVKSKDPAKSSELILNILNKYSKKLDISLRLTELQTLISKLSTIDEVLSIIIKDADDVEYTQITSLKSTYFQFSLDITYSYD